MCINSRTEGKKTKGSKQVNTQGEKLRPTGGKVDAGDGVGHRDGKTVVNKHGESQRRKVNRKTTGKMDDKRERGREERMTCSSPLLPFK